MDLAGIAVVNQETAFVVVARGSVRFAAAPAFPLLGIEIDAQVFSDQDFHGRPLSRSRARHKNVARLVDLKSPTALDAAGEEGLFEHARTVRLDGVDLVLDPVERQFDPTAAAQCSASCMGESRLALTA